MQHPDASNFSMAIIKEFNRHLDKNHLKVVSRDTIPDGRKVLPMVWSMRHKRDVVTNQVTKYNARINSHGGKQEFGVKFFETYAPVVT